MLDLIYKKESYDIIGACFEVHNAHGHGFDEAIYHESLLLEFGLKKLPAVSEPQLEVKYKGVVLKKKCRPDFVCYSKIILEIKAAKDLTDTHRSQVFNYLKATGFKLGLLVNFGSEDELQYKRIVL